MKPDLVKVALPLGLLGLNLAISLGFLLSGRLPDPAPSSFWFDGSVVAEAAPWVVAFRLPLIAGLLLLGILVGLKWDPLLKSQSRRRRGAWGLLTNLFLVMACVTNFKFLSIVSHPGAGFTLEATDLVVMGVVMLALGNGVAKSASNGFWGLSNRWTRMHETIERRSNRLLGILWMSSGLGLALAGQLLVKVQRPLLDGLLLVITMLPLLVAVVASYRYSQQLAAPMSREQA